MLSFIYALNFLMHLFVYLFMSTLFISFYIVCRIQRSNQEFFWGGGFIKIFHKFLSGFDILIPPP